MVLIKHQVFKGLNIYITNWLIIHQAADGDVILMINHKDIENVEQFNELVKSIPKEKSVPLLIQRRGETVFLALKLLSDKE